ncbi:protein of unknown function [Serratia sp. Tan611]|nr:protein of unknown function [Serratia sp. Tan611]
MYILLLSFSPKDQKSKVLIV